MKFLIDTNIFIPLEPTQPNEVGQKADRAAEFFRLAADSGNQIYLHPLIKTDFERDTNKDRQKLRTQMLKRYSYLVNPPELNSVLNAVIGTAPEGSNDWVDNNLISALHGDAVDYLVTDDDEIHKKAKKLNLSDRVLTTNDAIGLLAKFYDKALVPPPAVQSTQAYSLNEADPIFDELRSKYPDFDGWLKKCKREHRQTWVIAPSESKLAAICIIKKETPEEYGLTGKVMKVCLFKVSPDFAGYRFGELLLKAVFTHAHENSYDGLFVTTFSEQQQLIRMFNDFGFIEISEKTNLGEVVLIKKMKPTTKDYQSLDSLTLNIRFGPFVTKFESTPCYIIPVQPRFHSLLFPEAEKQASLFSGQNPFGNSIRKAYLSQAVIKTLPEGSNILFYRSEDQKAVTVLGIAETTMRSQDAMQVARFVGKRTVYSFEEIQRITAKETIVILFRQIKVLKVPITYDELKGAGILNGPPQSITTIPQGGIPWLKTRLEM